MKGLILASGNGNAAAHRMRLGVSTRKKIGGLSLKTGVVPSSAN